MNAEKLKEKIKLAKQAVEGESEPYKTEAFKIILSKLLESHLATSQEKDLPHPIINIESKTPKTNIDEKKKELAKQCNITIEELNNVLSIKDDIIEIISPVLGSNAQKHVIVAQCVLASSEVIFERYWTPSLILTQALRSLGVKDLSNLSYTLRNYPDLFIGKGTRGHKEYRLTSGGGRREAFNTIHKLAKGIEINY